MARAKAWFRDHHKEQVHPHFERIIELFFTKYGELEGLQKYVDFLQAYKLDVSRSYKDQARDHNRLKEFLREEMFREGFSWVPQNYLRKISQDRSAVYYKVECLDAVISLNDKDYTNYTKMIAAAKSMNFRPININHNFPPRGKWVSYPRTRLEYSKAEDFKIEGILRVDRQDDWLIKAIGHDPSVPKSQWIMQPSIEGRPDLDKQGYHFMALSLLEMGYALPGVPTLAPITPFFHEGVTADGVCVFLDSGVKFCLENGEVCDTQTGKSDITINVEHPQLGVTESMSSLEQTNFRCRCPKCGTIHENVNKECESAACSECQHIGLVSAGPNNTVNQGTHPELEAMLLESKDITLEIAEAILTILEAEAFDCPDCLVLEAAGFNPSADWPDSCYAYVPAEAKGPEGTKSARKFPYKFPDGRISVPNVRNALARLAGAAIPDEVKSRIRSLMQRIMSRVNPDYKPADESLEKMIELFRPPWPERHASQFKSAQDLPVLPATNIPTVGQVISNVDLYEKVKEVIRKDLDAEYAQKEAVHISDKTRLENRLASLEQIVRDKDTAYADLQRSVANLERDSGRTLEQMNGMQGEVGELTKSKVLLEQQVRERDGTVRQLQDTISDRDAKVKRIEGDLLNLREELGALNASIEDLRVERNNLSVNYKGAEEKALNETKERSRIQQENAGLRDQIAGYVNNIATLSDEIATKSRTVMEMETNISTLKEEKRTLEEGARQMLENNEAIKTLNKQAWKRLNKEGIFAISNKGDLVVGTPDLPADEE